jgi:hypothetical protein
MSPQMYALLLALAGGLRSMVDPAWLVHQNFLHAANRRLVGAVVRNSCHGHGRRAARDQWVIRRSLARLRCRRRHAVVGRVRLYGKGPPPRAGPLLQRRSTGVDQMVVASEPTVRTPDPIDEEMFQMLGDRMLEYDNLQILDNESKQPKVPPIPRSWNMSTGFQPKRVR